MDYGLDSVVYLTRSEVEIVRQLVSTALWGGQFNLEADSRDLSELHIKLSNRIDVRPSKPVVMRNG